MTPTQPRSCIFKKSTSHHTCYRVELRLGSTPNRTIQSQNPITQRYRLMPCHAASNDTYPSPILENQSMTPFNVCPVWLQPKAVLNHSLTLLCLLASLSPTKSSMRPAASSYPLLPHPLLRWCTHNYLHSVDRPVSLGLSTAFCSR